jgi:glycosyltransferase XagB
MTTALAIAYALLSLGLLTIAAVTLWCMVYAWRTPEALEATCFGAELAAPRSSFSLIVPARHEELVLEQTLKQLTFLDHPDYEVLVVVGHDDPGTRNVAELAAERWPDVIRVIVDHSRPKNKPRALNAALPECRGAIVGVFDAEDGVSPGLLRQIDACMRRTGAHVVQGGVQLMNLQSSWYAARNVLEYFFWFKSRLHLHADRQFVPLGGNTVFVRTRLLRAVGGWDPDCLAEDCDLGVRLSVLGARIVVAYDPALVTQEETPGSLRALLKQRTRWNHGYLQVLRKGDWRRLPARRQRVLAAWTLSMPFLQAVAALVLPLSLVTMLLVELPVPLALVSYAPLLVTVLTVLVELAGLQEFGQAFGVRVRARDHLRVVVGTAPYQWVLGVAAARAVSRELRGERAWEKTPHTGAHRRPPRLPRTPA